MPQILHILSESEHILSQSIISIKHPALLMLLLCCREQTANGKSHYEPMSAGTVLRILGSAGARVSLWLRHRGIWPCGQAVAPVGFLGGGGTHSSVHHVREEKLIQGIVCRTRGSGGDWGNLESIVSVGRAQLPFRFHQLLQAHICLFLKWSIKAGVLHEIV